MVDILAARPLRWAGPVGGPHRRERAMLSRTTTEPRLDLARVRATILGEIRRAKAKGVPRSWLLRNRTAAVRDEALAPLLKSGEVVLRTMPGYQGRCPGVVCFARGWAP
jgi:hypothetical protein